MGDEVGSKKHNWTSYAYLAIISIIILFGIAIRIYVYSLGRSFWLDEASLFLNLKESQTILNNMQYMQAAPPIFKAISLFFLKLLSNENLIEYTTRFFPLLCGITSIPIFYLVARKVLNSKLAQIIAIFLFVINHQLIYFSSEFKQYCSDMLLALLIIYAVLKANPLTAAKKRLTLLSIFFAASMWLSHTALFMLAGVFICCFWIFKSKEMPFKTFFKKLFCLFAPSALSFVAFWSLHLNSVSGSEYMHNYWANWFITDTNSLIFVIKSYLLECFMPATNYISILILAAVGLIILLSKKTKETGILLAPFFVVFAAAMLSIYPIAYRLELFLLPFIIIFISGIFEVVSTKKPFRALLVGVFFIWTFSAYVYPYLPSITRKSLWLREEMGAIYEYLKEKDNHLITIALPSSAKKQDLIYKDRYPLKSEKIFLNDTKDGYTEKSFSELTKGKLYNIVYLNHDTHRKKLHQLVDWMKNNTYILHQHIYYNNYVFLVEIK